MTDLFTKPLQGRKFNLSRTLIIGWDDVATLWDESDDKKGVINI